MKTWKRAAIDHLCGRCGKAIAVGDPVLVLEAPGIWTGQKFRCSQFACAQEAVPADVPPVKGQDPIRPMVRIGRNLPGDLPLDWKATRAGKDE